MSADQAKLKILQQLIVKPDSSQRELAQALGISLGSVNFCLQALMEKGYIKMHKYHNQHNKLSCAYLLTPAGMRQKIVLTKHFLAQKMQEFDALSDEIAALQLDMIETLRGEIAALRRDLVEFKAIVKRDGLSDT